MTPKEKAEELIYKYFDLYIDYLTCKQCALIAVDEILHEIIYKNPSASALSRINYWEEVKNEIEKL